MADNIIQRIIKLVLDKDSAKKTQRDANEVAEGIDLGWKEMATKIAKYLTVAFAVDKLIEFGKKSVEEATKAQRTWTLLGNAIDANGGSFKAMEEHIREAADAFEDATVHGNDDYAESLARMVTLTGDISASTKNMGLVANVAAQFFGGDLAPAVELVSKVMNGNVMMLQRMGIHAKDAQQGLEILAKRSMGAATKEAQTFGGQMKQLDNLWLDFTRDVGFAVVKNNDAVDSIGLLRNVVRTMDEWVNKNRESISKWVTNGVALAIDAADYFIRGVGGMALILSGGLQAAIGLSVLAFGKLVSVLATVDETENKIRKSLGQDVTEREKNTKVIRDQADALEEWGKNAFNAGSDKNTKGMELFAKRLFSSDSLKGLGKNIPKLEVGTPTLGKNVVTEDMKKIQEAIKTFREDTKAAANMQKILGKEFDATSAEIERTTKVMNVLAGQGIKPTSVGLGDLGARLKILVAVFKPTRDALKAFNEETLSAQNMQRILGDKFDSTGAEIERTTKLLNALAAHGIDPASIGLGDLGGRLELLTKQLHPVEEAAKSLKKSMDADLALGVITAANSTLVLKERQRDLLTQIQQLTDLGFSPQSDKIKSLRAQYNGLGDTIAAVAAQNTVDKLKKQQEDVLATIKQLLDAGVDPASDAIKILTKQYDSLTMALSDQEVIANLTKAFSDMGDEVRDGSFMASLDESTTKLDLLKIQQGALQKAMQTLLSQGISPQSKAMQDLVKQYKDVSGAIKEQTIAMQLQAAAADFLADALGTALQGGLHEAAAQKAKQNAIESAEMLVRAGVFALFGNGPQASASLVLAAQFAGIAAAWGALAAGTHGSDTSASAPTVGSAGSDIGSARSASSTSAAQAPQQGADVTIYLVGPGFNALNPEVQRVVYGAQREAEQRFGPNARIRVAGSP